MCESAWVNIISQCLSFITKNWPVNSNTDPRSYFWGRSVSFLGKNSGINNQDPQHCLIVSSCWTFWGAVLMTDVLSRSLKQILMWTEHRHVFSFWARFIKRFLYKLGKIVQEEYVWNGRQLGGSGNALFYGVLLAEKLGIYAAIVVYQFYKLWGLPGLGSILVEKIFWRTLTLKSITKNKGFKNYANPGYRSGTMIFGIWSTVGRRLLRVYWVTPVPYSFSLEKRPLILLLFYIHYLVFSIYSSAINKYPSSKLHFLIIIDILAVSLVVIFFGISSLSIRFLLFDCVCSGNISHSFPPRKNACRNSKQFS